MIVRKIQITALLMLLLSGVCAVKSATVLLSGDHLGSRVENACFGLATDHSKGSNEQRVAESCQALRKEIHSLREAQINGFLWLLVVAGALFAWGSALLIWSRAANRAVA